MEDDDLVEDKNKLQFDELVTDYRFGPSHD